MEKPQSVEELRDAIERLRTLLLARGQTSDGSGRAVQDSVLDRNLAEMEAALARVAELPAREEDCEALLDAIPANVAILDANGVITQVNAGWRRFGEENGADRATTEGVGIDYLAVCREAQGPSSEGARQCLEGLQALLAGRLSQFEMEYPCHSPTAQRWFQLRALSLAGSAGGAVLSHIDITQLKLAQQALREGEKRFRRLVDSNIIGIVLTDIRGAIHEANDSFLQMMGLTREDLEAGRVPWDKMLPQDDRALVSRAVEELLRTGAAGPWEQEAIRADGTRIPVLVGAALLEEARDEAVAFVLDLSERKCIEEELRRSTERFQALSTSAPIGIFEMDAQGNCLYVNPRWEEITGLAAADALGWGWLQAIHPDERERVRGFYSGTPPTQEQSEEIRHVAPDGGVLYEHVRVAPMFTPEGKLRGYVGTLEDITERKRSEQERAELLQREQAALSEAHEASAAKDRFLAVLSHELRNPLSPILAGVDVLRHQPPGSERGRRAVEIIERNAKLQARLVNDLLDLSRVARGKLHIRQEPVRLDSVVRAVVHDQTAGAEAANLDLEARLQQGLWVTGDPDRLQQIVGNLVNNAIKYTPPGGRVCVLLESSDGRARISVEDTGIGIDPDLLPRLFDMFQQGEVAGRRAPGLGIGLSLVRSLTEMHGGRVWAESAGTGKGSRFVVELPLRLPEPESAPHPSGETPGEAKVLLVEDNDDQRLLIAESLEMMGYVVTAVPTAEDALVQLRQARPDIILADIGLPGMDGYEFMERAREMDGLRDVPAFALTGFGSEEDVRRALGAGYSGHLIKPVDVSDLDARIRRRLARGAG